MATGIFTPGASRSRVELELLPSSASPYWSTDPTPIAPGQAAGKFFLGRPSFPTPATTTTPFSTA